jgi:hypothetical protein
MEIYLEGSSAPLTIINHSLTIESELLINDDGVIEITVKEYQAANDSDPLYPNIWYEFDEDTVDGQLFLELKISREKLLEMCIDTIDNEGE